MGNDMRPYLDVWDQDQSTGASLQLAWYLLREIPALLKYNSVPTPGSQDSDHQSAQGMQVAEWLARPAIRERLERAFLEETQSPHATVLSEAVDWHQRWCAAR
jgi:hypothetical protein